MVTYEKEPDADLACLLLFRARSLSPCVRPLRSSSSLYCKSFKDLKQRFYPSGRGSEQTHQFHFFLLRRLVLVAAVDGDVIHPRQDPGHLAVLSLLEHLLPEHVSIGPQAVLLSERQHLKYTRGVRKQSNKNQAFD